MAINKARRAALGATAIAALGAALASAPASAITINDGYTPAQAVDPTNITGVGQMVSITAENDDGSINLGLCTATLINPRTVILAAHCVNEQPASSYGSAHGGTPIGVGFQADNLRSLINWAFGGLQSSATDHFYNGSYVVYNQHSLDLGPDNNYLQGDVAMIAFNTPVTGVPTHDMLFSPLTGPTHAIITGYGGNGTGTTGSDGSNIDYKRRIAENVVSVLGSLDDLDKAFGYNPEGLPQNLYQADFNSPGYESLSDFGLFGDTPLPKEGITAPGDSGGPLLIDQEFARPVIAGVLSGGLTFGGQVQAGYGTSSFYQPLYLYWDWIVANNPYKYVGAKAGDGSWTDPNHWVINLDPVYQTIGADGQLVNALPTTPAGGLTGDSPKFGYVCDGLNCTNIATGEVVPQSPTDGTPETGSTSNNAKGAVASNDKGGMQLSLNGATVANDKGGTTAKISSPTSGFGSSGGSVASLASPQDAGTPAEGSAMVGGELVQGAPGSSNFVPDDTDGDVTTGAPARYYDVTLSADGTTTLSGADIIIDRLTISGAKSNLTIAADANLGTLIDTTQANGVMTVDGQYVSIGEYYLAGGLLQGNGSVVAPDIISMLGAIAPGRLGTIGTLTVGGNVILSSGTRTYMDIGATTADKLAIVANPFVDPAAGGQTGVGDLGGILALAPAKGYHYDPNRTYTLITADGGLLDHFSAVTELSAILYPVVTQTADTLSVKIRARPYTSVVSGSPIQDAYAQLLDRSRAGGSYIQGFYDRTDVMDLGTIKSTLEQAGPFAQQTELSLVRMQDEALAKFYRDRLSLLRHGGGGDTLAVLGNPLGVIRTGYQTARDVASGLMQAPTNPQQTAVKLPEGVSAYIAGGYLDGSSRPLPNLISGKKDDLSGWYVAGGLEKQIDDKTIMGLSASYSHGKGDTILSERARSNLFELTAYGTYSFGNGGFINTSVTGGLISTKTRRQYQIADVTAKLHNEENAPIVSGEFALGYDMKTTNFTITPMASIRSSHLEFEGGQESGGIGSLTFNHRNFNSIQARVGGQVAIDVGGVHPHVDAAFVHDFLKNGEDILAHFTEASGTGLPSADFGSFGRDRNWGEVGGGLSIVSGTTDIGVSADTVFGRKDLSYQVYRGSVTFHF
ncbi:autotransporter domain-containing protein [Sphingomonas sp. CGMCC 1.13654]|uniref:Autotransporter domain-containing protein n=1 Tax=Sphingomonas chungangi TaxID=2683589 RepID=A0A838L4Q1_9SPHN|nr:autotransporter outer membrane beta-barrel domain-containing protein [Sphingomonas chungangi]MBA2933186.1 autotransporter domain-containing protein [Sphingomonas chungangi]MVW57858.1 autotransporter domain-containing protein [Sphingomonas chungangi]